MKKAFKIFLIIFSIFASLLLILLGSLLFVTRYRYTDIDTQISPDERCQLTLQMKGEPEWPFGRTYGRIIVRYDDEIFQKIDFAICDDGAMLREENWNVVWNDTGAQVTLMGSEQDDETFQIWYDEMVVQ